jgi:hypothetical protein
MRGGEASAAAAAAAAEAEAEAEAEVVRSVMCHIAYAHQPLQRQKGPAPCHYGCSERTTTQEEEEAAACCGKGGGGDCRLLQDTFILNGVF